MYIPHSYILYIDVFILYNSTCTRKKRFCRGI